MFQSLFEQWKASFGPVFNFPIWSPKKKILLATAKAESELRKKDWKAIIFQAIEEIESSTKSYIMGKNEYALAKKSSFATKSILDTSKESFGQDWFQNYNFWKMKGSFSKQISGRLSQGYRYSSLPLIFLNLWV